MDLNLQFNTSGIDWERVALLLKKAGMAYHPAEVHKCAFENSRVVVFAFRDTEMIGFGRAISDGAYQAALYDVAVSPEYQGKGVGKLILENIISRCPGCHLMLYAAPGKDKFYEKFSFRKMLTGMALFTNADKMRERGFTE